MNVLNMPFSRVCTCLVQKAVRTGETGEGKEKGYTYAD